MILHYEGAGEVSCPIWQLPLSRDRGLIFSETPRRRLARPPTIFALIRFAIWGACGRGNRGFEVW
jgi:hypothetical protein